MTRISAFRHRPQCPAAANDRYKAAPVNVAVCPFARSRKRKWKLDNLQELSKRFGV